MTGADHGHFSRPVGSLSLYCTDLSVSCSPLFGKLCCSGLPRSAVLQLFFVWPGHSASKELKLLGEARFLSWSLAWLSPCLGASSHQYQRKPALGYFRSFALVFLDSWLWTVGWKWIFSPWADLILQWWSEMAKLVPGQEKVPGEQLQLGLQ